jgi:simple sugar transport system substrate-binding protein
MKSLRIKAGLALGLAATLSLAACSSTSSSSTTATASNTASAVGWCSGVKIAAFPGGPQGGVFANNVYNGYKQAAKDLGPSVQYYFSDWDPNKLVSQMKEALASKPDGMAIYGFGGPEATTPIVNQAFAQGTIVSSLNSELPALQAKYGAKGFGYVGAQLHKAGLDLANEMIKRGNLKSGDQAFVWGLKGAAGDRAQRTVGVIDGFQTAGLKVIYQEIDQATNTTPAAGAPTFAGIMAKNPGVKAVVTDHGGLTATAETYMKAANKAPGSVIFGGFDVSPATVTAIQSGYLQVVIDQQPFLQGYLPILNICLTKKFGFSGLYVNTSGGFVDKNNVAFVAPLALKEIR